MTYRVRAWQTNSDRYQRRADLANSSYNRRAYELYLNSTNSPDNDDGNAFRPMDSSAKLAGLRALFDKHGIDIYIVLTQDAHESETPARADRRRAFISGFSGSAGTAVISRTKAALATDGRYFLQAERQLDKNWTLLKQGVAGVPSWQEWVANELLAKPGSNVGIDPRYCSYGEYTALSRVLERYGLKDALVPIKPNLVDHIWEDQPKQSETPLKILPIEFTGKRFQDKLTDLRQAIKAKNGTGFLVSALDDVAWLYNLRCDDIPYSPVFRAFSYVTAQDAILYIDEIKITDQVRKYLGKHVTIKPYDEVAYDAKQAQLGLLSINVKAKSIKERRTILVSQGVSWELYDALGAESSISIIASPVELAKSVKNPIELKGHKAAQIEDGVALIRYFAWLENELHNGNTSITEYGGSAKADEFRAEMDNYEGLAYETISSTGANAAVIHYAPSPDGKTVIDKEQIYLIDSGGQYLNGTVDITRTLHFGTPTAEEIQAYTLVLKGHIALASIIFPEGVDGYQLDVLARQHLWKYGLDYRHGTGHGVGSYLNVHEGPMGFGIKPGLSDNALRIGNVISNEPGYYKDGHFGIRIESEVVVTEVKTPQNFGGKKYLGLDTITRVPLCQELIDVALLTPEEVKWINEYHEQVFSDTYAYLAGDKLSKAWLKRQTKKLVK